MDEHEQHSTHDHSKDGQQKKNHSQHDASEHEAHAALDHSMHTMSDHAAHAKHQDRVIPASNVFMC